MWANYRDESFILQFLSPRLIREFGLFHGLDYSNEPTLRVEAIHDERGYRRYSACTGATIRHRVDAAGYPGGGRCNLAGDRRLIVHHRALNRVLLEERDTRFVLQHLADLWGYDVLMKEIDPGTDSALKEQAATPRGGHPAARWQLARVKRKVVRPDAGVGYHLSRSRRVGSWVDGVVPIFRARPFCRVKVRP